MKISIVSHKNSKQDTAVKEVVRKLYPSAEIVLKDKFTLKELEGSILLESDVYDKSRSVMIRKIIEALDLGVADSVIEKIK